MAVSVNPPLSVTRTRATTLELVAMVYVCWAVGVAPLSWSQVPSFSQARQGRGIDLVPVLPQDFCHKLVAPATVSTAMNQYKCRHIVSALVMTRD